MSQINRHVLPNGLRIVHLQDKATQMVALNLLYDVGAKDESPTKTGFAHLFEHLMFSGSKNIPDFDLPLQRAGGENNAWTNNDITNYYLTLPKQNVEIGFWLESDRMLGLLLNSKNIKTQKGVVIEEFKQRNLNQPYGDVGHLVRDLAYKVHPYKWPTIGLDVNHIKEATKEDVIDFYNRFYTPNNAILAVTGNIDFEKVVELSKKWFGPIQRTSSYIKPIVVEPLQTETRRQEVVRSVSADSLFMVFQMCDRKNEDYYVYDILSDVLSNGSSSRFYQNLVLDKKIFLSLDAYISGSIDKGLFYICGKPNSNVSLEEAEKEVWIELERIKNELVDEKELLKVKNKYESNFIFSNINYLNVATNLAWFELLGDANEINNEVMRYKSVDSERLQQVAQKALIPENCSVLYYRKEVRPEDNTQ